MSKSFFEASILDIFIFFQADKNVEIPARVLISAVHSSKYKVELTSFCSIFTVVFFHIFISAYLVQIF